MTLHCETCGDEMILNKYQGAKRYCHNCHLKRSEAQRIRSARKKGKHICRSRRLWIWLPAYFREWSEDVQGSRTHDVSGGEAI